MKKVKEIFLGVFLLSSLCAAAQDTTAVSGDTSHWTVQAYAGINLNQVSFTNWAAGGDNAVSFGLVYLNSAKYAKNRHTWDNLINIKYGLLWTKSDGMQKNEDQLELETKYGFLLDQKKTWALSVLGNFKSQFAKGYFYPNDSVVISKFASPGYLTLAIGIDWKPKDYFSLFVSPASGRFLFVRDEAIANSGIYGNDPGTPIIDTTTGFIIGYSSPGDRMRFDFGGYISAKFNKEVMKNLTILSKADVFFNYTGDTKDSKVPDVNWETAFLFKFNEWFSASLTLTLIYDKEILIPKDNNENGEFELNEFTDRVQFKEALALGFTYKFSNKKPKK